MRVSVPRPRARDAKNRAGVPTAPRPRLRVCRGASDTLPIYDVLFYSINLELGAPDI